MNKSMVSTIRVLESDNKHLMDELQSLRSGLDLKSNNKKVIFHPIKSKQDAKLSNPMTTETKPPNRNQILIIGKDIRGYLPLFKQLTKNKYDINSQSVKETFVEDLIEHSKPYCRNVTKHDFVFLFLDSWDSVKGKNVSSEKL